MNKMMGCLVWTLTLTPSLWWCSGGGHCCSGTAWPNTCWLWGWAGFHPPPPQRPQRRGCPACWAPPPPLCRGGGRRSSCRAPSWWWSFPPGSAGWGWWRLKKRQGCYGVPLWAVWWVDWRGPAGAWPEHGFEDRLQGDLQVQLVGAGKLHVDGFVSGDDVARVVHALDPNGVLIHDVRSIRLPHTNVNIFI